MGYSRIKVTSNNSVFCETEQRAGDQGCSEITRIAGPGGREARKRSVIAVLMNRSRPLRRDMAYECYELQRYCSRKWIFRGYLTLFESSLWQRDNVYGM